MFSFRSLLNKIAIAVGNVLMLAVVDKFGYNADVMSKTTNNLAKPLIESTTQASIVGGVKYNTLLNVIFFMLTAFGAVGLILQVIPMLFYQFDEKAQEGKLKAFRDDKDTKYFFSDFYNGIDNMKTTVELELENDGKSHNYKIYAVDSWGEESENCITIAS